MSEKSEAEESKSEFSQFASAALRGPRKGIYEQLLCQHLVLSVTSKPLKKIRLICEAAMMIQDSEKQNINMELVEILNKVAIAFQHSIHYKSGGGARYCIINWSFDNTEEVYEKFIEPWRGHAKLFFFPTLQYDQDRAKEEYEQVRGMLSKLERWEWFFTVTRHANLAERSYNMLAGCFISWALPQIMKVFAQLSKLVQPSLYREMLALLTSKPEKSGESESSMGSRE